MENISQGPDAWAWTRAEFAAVMRCGAKHSFEEGIAQPHERLGQFNQHETDPDPEVTTHPEKGSQAIS